MKNFKKLKYFRKSIKMRPDLMTGRIMAKFG